MIPKIIHYCWFGKNDKSEIIKKCINSWKEKLKGYKFVEWNESNFDITKNIFCRQAYENEKWAFVSDYVRIKVLLEYGGVYLDTDLEITNDISELIEGKNLVLGYYSNNSISGGFFACNKQNDFFIEVINKYESIEFINDEEKYKCICNNNIINDILVNKYNVQLDNSIYNKNNIVIYPKEYINEKGKNIKNYAIHHDQASWVSRNELLDRIKSYKYNYKLGLRWIDKISKDGYILNEEYSQKEIVIYGLGEYGKRLLEECREREIEVNCIVDNGYVCDKYKGINVIKNEELHSVTKENTMIIITPTHKFDEIFNGIKAEIKDKVISLDYLLEN